MARERVGHSLQATALVNEAYLRLVDVRQMTWQDRAHFFAMSARLMRRILVDFARSRGYQKRGGGAHKVSFDEGLVISNDRGHHLVALDDPLVAVQPSAQPSSTRDFSVVLNWLEELKRRVPANNLTATDSGLRPRLQSSE